MGAPAPVLGAILPGALLSQHARLITLSSAQESNLPESLMAEQFTGREAINELFSFELDALSVSTEIDLNLFIGEEITIALLQADGSRRAWHGLCFDAAWLGADGGVTRYRLRLEPALALLRMRRDSYLFQNKNAQEIITELLLDYPQVRFEFDLTQTLAKRAICTQYRESDLDFLLRLLALEGLNFRFEHQQQDDQEEDQATKTDTQARHKLVIFDSKAQAPEMPGGLDLRFHGVRASEAEDAIDQFAAVRQASTNAVTISSWDPQQLLAPAAEHASSLDAGALPSLALYDGSGERRQLDGAGANRHAERMLQALELDNKRFDGAGAVRQLAAGHGFRLTGHDHYLDGADRFTVLWVRHAARNNTRNDTRNNTAPGLAGSGNAVLADGTYRNSFACVRDTVALLPRASAAILAGSAPGPQSALVVGLPDAIASTGRDHQVKIQFAWQRGAAPNPGGISHDDTNLDQGNAPGNQASGAWVRVAEALAGPNWGSQFTPRIGTEVLVDFIEADIDRPVVVAQLYSGADTPPYSAGVDSSINHAGVLSGIRSNNFDGAGYNQLVIDDSPGQLRTRLATSSAATQLSLGYLVQHAADSASRGSYRGAGFELRTEAWAMLRAGEGMLISSTARKGIGAGVGVASTQLDAAEAVSQLKGANQLSQAITDAATAQNALTSLDANDAQLAFIAAIDPSDKGKHGAAVNGQDAHKTGPDGRQADSASAVEKFATPLVLMEAPAAINWATPASTLVFAGQQLQWTSQADLHIAAAHTASAVVANAIGLFSHDGGIQAIAGNGALSLQAHTDQLEILADKAITVISVNGAIEIKASQKIKLQSGSSSVTLDGANITFACPGNFTVKGGQHVFGGGGRKTAGLPVLPVSIIKPTLASRMESTFAFDQLTRVAKNSTKAEFIAIVVPIFGFDIPAKTYIKLYDKLRDGAIVNPKIKVMSGSHYPAEFDNKTRDILVHETAAERAPKIRDSAWLLLTALLHEFGHYIDLVLRQDLADKNSDGSSTLAPDAKDDEGARFAYQIAYYDFENTSEAAYATYASPDYSGTLKVNYAAARTAIQATQGDDAQRIEGKRGTAELFGAGRGENNKNNPHGSFGHESIEDALTEAKFGLLERKQIYFGNWLRDFSQLLDPKIVRKPGAAKDFPSKLGRDQLTWVVAVLAEEAFVEKPEEKPLFLVTQKNLGVYRPTEHIDNPTNNDPKAENPQSVDPDFEPMPGKSHLEIDPATSMKHYIGGSKEYMKAELKKAMAAGKNADGFRHFGAALHVLEDYFAHSNFVELSLRKVGYKDVLPWTSPANGKHPYPVVTGMFDSEDVIASAAGLIANIIFKVQWEFQASKPGERTKSDRIMLILLEEHSDPIYLTQFKNYLAMRDAFARMPGHQYIEGAMHYTVGTISNAYNFMYNSLLHLIGNSVDDAQFELAGNPNTNGSTNPTHSQLAKDHDNHPFHMLAALLAKAAVFEVGKDMHAHWSGNIKADPATTAATYFVHPMDSTWQDGIVSNWARTHPTQIKRGASETEWKTLRKEHEKEVRDGIAKAGQRSDDIWNYINTNYDAIFGGKNQVKK